MDINKPIPVSDSSRSNPFNDHSTSILTSNNPFLVQFNTYLEKNFASFEIDNSNIAKHLGLSNRQLYRKTLKAVGVTPNRYITKYRMDKAKILLSSGQYYTAKEVTSLVGYKKSSYFSQLFKAEFNETPFQFLCRIGIRQSQNLNDN